METQQKFFPGDPVPESGHYQEHDPGSQRPVRDLLIPAGDGFPQPLFEGGFFTLLVPASRFAPGIKASPAKALDQRPAGRDADLGIAPAGTGEG